MGIFRILILLALPMCSFGAEAIFLSGSLSPTYASGGHESKSSLLGIGAGIGAGIRIGTYGVEGGFKQINVDGDGIGSKNYQTEIKDAIMFGGFRLFLNDIFTLKGGLALHNTEMDIFDKDTNARLSSQEEEGDFTGVYVGMGINHSLGKGMDFYYESSLYPINDIDMFFVDIEAGVRFYL